MDKLLSRLRVAYPDITFSEGTQCSWSPRSQTVIYAVAVKSNDAVACWSLLHELGHAVLGHKAYKSDLELLQLESEAWEQAKLLGQKYGYTIDEDHIQDCLDTYRDWLHQRSACPTCNNRSLQHSLNTYKCFNCNEVWSVTSARFCRPYRKKQSKNKTSPPESKVMFR
jgi:hypothetical protein